MPPLAYLLTWTCYGTWLHGDERGSVEAPQNRYGTSYIKSNAAWANAESRLLRSAPMVLNNDMRRTVRDAIIEHCPFKDASLRALNVRTTHVHLVVRSPTSNPSRLAGSFKAWATRRLREAGLIGPKDPVWTARPSTRYLWFEDAVNGAIRYVLEDQGPRDEFAVDGKEITPAARVPCVVLPEELRVEPPTEVGG